MLEIIPLPALKNHYNYIWLLQNKANRHIAIVDPGEAGPLLTLIDKENLIPSAILITHHHWDHVNGIADIKTKYDIPVYTPKTESVAESTHPVGEGDIVSLPELDLAFSLLDVPGHTAGAIAYYADGMVFSGDTLFAAGCGRMFEGTPVQMHASLSRFKNLPDDTLLYCGHEYTVNNLEFALNVEPDNPTIQARLKAARQLRSEDKATVPVKMLLEKETNPFLRCNEDSIVQAVETYSGKTLNTAAEVFAELRHWKDNF